METKRKYQDTYLVDDIKELIPLGSNRAAYEQRVKDIIDSLKGAPTQKYYIAAFPFFNRRNTLSTT